MSSVELTPKLKELLNSAEAEQDAGADLCREAEAEFKSSFSLGVSSTLDIPPQVVEA